MIHYIALLTALTVSAVAGYYSIVGLTAIFSSAFWPIVIMGTVLEIGKLVTASWLYRNWRQAGTLLKTYLTSAVVILMFITSIGIFGFLSRAHIEQTMAIANASGTELVVLENRINAQRQVVENFETQINVIDETIRRQIERNQNAINTANQQRRLRDNLVSQRNEATQSLNELLADRTRLQVEVRRLEAEVGPIKYIADMIFEDSGHEQLERAVRWLIILLVMVFDPLAVVLLIAANQGIMRRKNELTILQGNGIVIDETNIFKI